MHPVESNDSSKAKWRIPKLKKNISKNSNEIDDLYLRVNTLNIK